MVAVDSSLRRLGLLLVFLAGLAVACESGKDATPAGDTSTTAPAGTTKPPPPANIAALKVPGLGGNTVKAVRQDAEQKFKQLCGGDLCVKLAIVPQAKDSCEVLSISTSPPEGAFVKPCSVVQLLLKLDSSCAPPESTTKTSQSTLTTSHTATTVTHTPTTSS